MINTLSLPNQFRLDYGAEIEQEIERLTATILRENFQLADYPPRWVALKLLEQDAEIMERVQAEKGGAALLTLARERGAYLQNLYGDDPDLLIADRRYGYVNGLARQVLRQPALDRVTLTQRIDDLATHRWLGLPFFFAVMYIVFRLVIDVSAPFVDWMDSVINGPFANWLGALLEWFHAPEWITSLLINGILAGVGGVLVFVPVLVILYFFLAILEDSGYLSRAAFVMDRFMRIVGLHGKSFIPMILGFGCAVPAIYATRTLASRRDRILTALLVPLMSCSARLPVYVVFGLAFFGSSAGTIIWLLYLVGILVAALAGMFFTRTLLKPDVTSAFVLELPPYRRPALRSVSIHMWEHTREFIYKAGTLIVVISTIMWFLLNLPWGISDQRNSYFGQASAALVPVLQPLGVDSWETAGALVTGFVAKEVVVSTMSQIYSTEASAGTSETTYGQIDLIGDVTGIAMGFVRATEDAARILLSTIPGVNLVQPENAGNDDGLMTALQQHFTPLSAIAFLVFVLLYVPCVATLGAIRHEFGSRWAMISAVYQTGLAWVIAVLVYQSGRLLGLG